MQAGFWFALETFRHALQELGAMKKQGCWITFESLVHQHCRLFNDNFSGRDEYLHIGPVVEIRQAKVEFQCCRISFANGGLHDQFFARLPFPFGRGDDSALDCRLAFAEEIIHQWQPNDFLFFLGLKQLHPGFVHLNDDPFLDVGDCTRRVLHVIVQLPPILERGIHC